MEEVQPVLVERLKTQFELNEPIFTNEILEAMQDYSVLVFIN